MRIEIKFERVEKITTGTQMKAEDKDSPLKLVTTIKADVIAPPSAIARLHNLMKQDIPLHLFVSSDQGAFDLDFDQVADDGSTVAVGG